MRLVLPATYKGHLEIGCSQAMTSDITVNLEQGPSVVPCPKSADQVKVIQKDAELSPQPDVKIEKGSDGTPVGIEMEVK